MQIFSVNPVDPDHQAAARQAFGEIFAGYWPHYLKLEAIDSWLSDRKRQQQALDEGREITDAIPVIMLAREGGGHAPGGIFLSLFFPRSLQSLTVFSAVAPALKGQGIGRALFEAQWEQERQLARHMGGNLRCDFAETMNPEHSLDAFGLPRQREGMFAADRKKVFGKLGYLQFPAKYIQPFTYILPHEAEDPHDHDPETGAFSSYDLMIRPFNSEPHLRLAQDFAQELWEYGRPKDPLPNADHATLANTLRKQALSDRALEKFSGYIAAAEPDREGWVSRNGLSVPDRSLRERITHQESFGRSL